MLINSTTKLNARLTENLSLSTAFLLNFDSQPPVAADGTRRKETDIALTGAYGRSGRVFCVTMRG